MEKHQGNRIFEGYALAKLVIYKKKDEVKRILGQGPEIEFKRFEKARSQTVESLNKSFNDTLIKLGKDEAQLFETHKLMAEDLDFEDEVRANLEENVTAEYAVQKAGKSLSTIFSSMDDAYMKERSKDVIEVAEKIVSFLRNETSSTSITEPSILLCEDLPSSELMKFDTKLLKGIVFTKGSSNSHVAILTRMLEIPSICGLDLEITDSLNNEFAILDGSKADFIIDPDSKTITKYNKLKVEYEQNKEKLKSFIGKETKTLDGKKTKIYCNIASSYEVENALKNDAEGIGLFRSEFLYLESTTFPTEDEQFEHYKRVIEAMKGKEVIIRTLDIGADKKIDYFNLPDEENPALGYRSIRICKDRPEIFLTQLQALYRASAYGNLSIMVPMIISSSEIKFIHEMASIAMDNLDSRGIKYNKDLKIGIMVETPAAAIMSDQFAKQVGFFSIGTNDLSQYTLAIDRVNPNLTSSFNPHHKAILRLIKLSCENAHKAGIPIGICGELGRDKELLPFFLKIGIDELSVSPTYVLSLREQISKIDTSKVDITQYID